MPPPEETRDEAIRRLEQRAGALVARTVQTPRDEHGAQAASYGYRLLGLLLGGVFVGLGFGAAIDWVANTGPWGMIIGVLVGFAVSIWMTVRSAQRMTEEAARDWGPPKDLGPDDEDD
jgi:ATP synthase protein I